MAKLLWYHFVGIVFFRFLEITILIKYWHQYFAFYIDIFTNQVGYL